MKQAVWIAALMLVALTATACQKQSDTATLQPEQLQHEKNDTTSASQPAPAPQPTATPEPTSAPSPEPPQPAVPEHLVVPWESGVSKPLEPGGFFISEIKTGDNVGDLTVQNVIRKGLSGEIPYVYAQFEGQLHLHGTFEHTDPNYEFLSDQVLFHVAKEDVSKLPHPVFNAQYNSERNFFVFSNRDQAVQEFGPAGSKGEATVEIDQYLVQYAPKEVYDHAKLLRVISKP